MPRVCTSHRACCCQEEAPTDLMSTNQAVPPLRRRLASQPLSRLQLFAATRRAKRRIIQPGASNVQETWRA